MPYRCTNCNRFVRVVCKCPECDHGYFECTECGELVEDEVEEI